jgi:hypothetical protein
MIDRRPSDAQISEALRAHLPVTAEAGLRGRVMDAVAITTQQRPLPSFFGALSDADPIGRRRSLLIAAAFLLGLAVATAAAVGAWRLLQRDVLPKPNPPPPFGLAKPGLIAFVGDEEWIHVANVDGTAERVLVAERGTKPRWSHDGTRLAYWSYGESVGDLALAVVDADGGHRVLLVDHLNRENQSWSAPEWSPSGDQLAYVETVESAVRLMIVGFDGRPPRVVAQNVTGQQAWSPNGRLLAFGGAPSLSGDGVLADYGVWTVPADGSAPPTRLSRTYGEDLSFNDVQWSPDGRQLAYRAGSGEKRDPSGDRVVTAAEYRIYLIDAEGRNEHRLTRYEDNEVFPVWSPTGETIAYKRQIGAYTDGSPMLAMMVVNPVRGETVQLAQIPFDIPLDSRPLWSPDGSRILVDALDRGYLFDPTNAASPVPAIYGDWQRLAP